MQECQKTPVVKYVFKVSTRIVLILQLFCTMILPLSIKQVEPIAFSTHLRSRLAKWPLLTSIMLPNYTVHSLKQSLKIYNSCLYFLEGSFLESNPPYN